MEDKLFGKVGRKIQIIAMIFFWLSVIGGVIAWLILITNSYESYRGETRYITADDWIGWVCLIGSLFSIIPSWFLYGFGELLENTAMINENTITYFKEKLKQKSDVWKCDRCGKENKISSGYCESCGKAKDSI